MNSFKKDTDQNVEKSENSESIASEIFRYFQTKIDSPFFMSYLFAWSWYNKDFFYYLFLSDDYNKVEKLTQWHFGLSGYIHPLLASVFIVLYFSAFSYFLSGLRYKITKKSFSFASKAKEDYDNDLKLNKLNIDIENQEKALKDINIELSVVEKRYLEVSERFKGVSISGRKAAELNVYKMFFDSWLFFSKDVVYEKSSFTTDRITASSRIQYLIDDVEFNDSARDFLARMLESEKLKEIAIELAEHDFRVPDDKIILASNVNLEFIRVWESKPV